MLERWSSKLKVMEKLCKSRNQSKNMGYRGPREFIHWMDFASWPSFLLTSGGIRGVVLTRMLLSLEKFLPPHPTSSSIVKCFDWMVGTSTGGILALALASGKSVLESQRIYLRLKERVFNAPKMPYDVHEMTNLLRAEFGDVTMSDISRHPKWDTGCIS